MAETTNSAENGERWLLVMAARTRMDMVTVDKATASRVGIFRTSTTSAVTSAKKPVRPDCAQTRLTAPLTRSTADAV
jgi:hypothetical protein